MSVTCYLLLAICYLLSDTCYLKIATSCENLIPFASVVRLALVLLTKKLFGQLTTTQNNFKSTLFFWTKIFSDLKFFFAKLSHSSSLTGLS